MNDLQLSEKVVADILTKLLPRGLRGLDIYKPADVTDVQIDTEHFRSIMLWLHSEGICKFEYKDTSALGRPRSANFLQVVLTSQGFNAMGHKFAAGNGETLARAAEKVSKGEKSYAGIGDLVGGILGGFTKSISS